MAEAVVSAVVNQLVSAGVDWLKDEISVIKGVKRKLHNMKNKMQKIQLVLEDAENQSVKRKIVKTWLKELQDVSYDMDDVLEQWSTTVHMLQREKEEAEENNISSPSPTAAKSTCFSLKKLNCFSSVEQLSWHREIALRVKDINQRIDLLFPEMKDFELVSKAVGNDDAMNKIISIARTTTAFVDETKVYGRADNIGFLLRKVLSLDTEQEKNPRVISIVGTGGLGKTTLAQMVYNDGKVKEKFGEKRIWVCVSDPFDEVKVAKEILEGLKVDQTNKISLQTLHQSIGESLSGLKFLLILDDVWNEDLDTWERLRVCLTHGDPDSRILVTTRKEKVASIMGTSQSNILKPQHLSDLDCWSIMSKIAFQGKTNKEDDKFENIGKEIAKKCKGLPLGAKTLGSMLISKDSVDYWKDILNSEIWKLEQVELKLFPHIFLSYQELPSVLKRCFLILAIFPKDTKLNIEEVIRIWMAHGFLNQGMEDMVKTGRDYLEVLVSRALFEEKESLISMHDIMHDFALYLSGDEVISIRTLDKIKNDNDFESISKRDLCLKSTTSRHLYLYIDDNIDPPSIGSVKKLRTCIIHNVATNVISDLVKELKMVRALYLVGCGLKEVPDSIEKLIHLRLLDLHANVLLVELPETIGGLYNLQSLLLQFTGISALPDSIEKLTNLIFLRTDYTSIEKYPESVGKLINLQDMGGILIVGSGYGELGFLKDLNQLRGKLEIGFESDYDDQDNVKKAAIQKKKHITELRLDFKYREVTDGVIAALQPPSNLQQLEIHHLLSSSLPGWITSLHHLTKLQVIGTRNIWTLPPLGELQSLKWLYLDFLDGLKMIGREFWGHKNDEVFVAFPTLLELHILDCNSLEEWSDIKAEDEGKVTVMPKLQQVIIISCRRLEVLPSRLLCRAASLEELSCEWNSTLGEYIKNDKQLLRSVKNVRINDEQCSLHPLVYELIL